MQAWLLCQTVLHFELWAENEGQINIFECLQ